MDFKEFAERMEQDVQSALAEGSPGARVTQHQTQKLQGESYTALSVFPADVNTAMNINLNQLYEAVQEGVPYEAVLENAIGNAENYLKTGGMAVDVSQLMDYGKAKELLCVEVIGTDHNKEMLGNIPHTELEDLSMVYRLQLSKNEDGLATVLVTNEMLKSYGIPLEQLHADAVENSTRIRPAVFKSMQEIMAEMMGIPADEMPPDIVPLHVVTNEEKIQGAAAMFYPDFMEQAAKELGGSYFILPSSVHEVLLLPDDGMARLDELKAMVSEVNAKEVQPKDLLSDQVYHFDAESRVFEVGEKFEARKAEKDKLNEKSASVIEDLRSKQKEAALKPVKANQPRTYEAAL